MKKLLTDYWMALLIVLLVLLTVYFFGWIGPVTAVIAFAVSLLVIFVYSKWPAIKDFFE